MTALGIADMHGKDGRGWPQVVLGALAAYVVYFAVRSALQTSGFIAQAYAMYHCVISVMHFLRAKDFVPDIIRRCVACIV